MKNAAVLILQKALENGLGRKNLNSSTLRGNLLFFQLKKSVYVINIETLEVFKIITNNDNESVLLNINDTSLLIQDYIQTQLSDKTTIDIITKQVCVERDIKL